MLGDLLGRGGMAEVFAGHAVGDHGFQKPVAIKRLLPELANDEVFVERLIEEAKLLVGMQHGHIVSVLDLAREGDDVFLVMEFVDGPSLRQLIKARGARGLSLGVATYIVQSAAAGLEFAHARPGGAIIHADISPSNLLLTTSGEVRVADFGIARREGLGHGVVEGKWAYMAPEQARGEPLSPRSDVFALGVVLYELLTGQHPFGRAVTANERDDQMQVIPPRVIKAAIPPGLDAICMRALAHDPRDRYGRMQHMIDALVEERFANGYREGAADLAQTIREVAPRSDGGAPRTMHTDRPVTIVTRSLLRELTPARRPSYPAMPSPLAPPRDEFPVLPTMGVATTPLPMPPRDEFPVVPTMGVATTALPTPLPAPPPDEFPVIPTSGAYTTAREVDQLALAQAAQAAAAMLEIPSVLRADGTPMPPFRASRADVGSDELASVVGGHTIPGHPGAVAVEVRGHRWTIGVLGAAALLGVIAAVVIQSSNSAADEPARVDPAKPVEAARLSANDPAAEVESHEAVPRVPAPLPVQPTIPESPVRPAEAAATPESALPEAADAKAAGGAGDVKPVDGSGIGASDAKATDSGAKVGSGTGASDARATDSAAKVGSGTSAGAGDARTGDPRTSDARISDDRAGKVADARASLRTDKPGTRGDPRQGAKRQASASKDTTKHKNAPGILSVQSVPWSWVTVDVETKETPAKFYLAPGTHTVKLYNQENGLTKYEKVVIEADKLLKLNEDMER